MQQASPLHQWGLGCPPRNIPPYHRFFPTPFLHVKLVASCWTCCCVIGALYLVSSVSFSCPTPSHPSGSPLLASVPRSGVSQLPWCHFCLSPPAQVCVAALDLPGGVIPLRRRVFHSPSDSRSSRTVWTLLCCPSSTASLSLRVAPATSAVISVHEVAAALCLISPAFRLNGHVWWKWPVSWHL